MQGQELAVEVGLHAPGVAVGDDLGLEVDLDALDGSFDPRTFCVELSFGQQVLGMVPIELGSEVAVDTDVSTRPFGQAGVSVGAVGTDGLTCVIVGGSPQEAFIGSRCHRP